MVHPSSMSRGVYARRPLCCPHADWRLVSLKVDGFQEAFGLPLPCAKAAVLKPERFLLLTSHFMPKPVSPYT